MDEIRVGIVGLGYMGLHHLKLLNQMIRDGFIDDLSIEIVCDPDSEHLESVVSKYGVSRSSTDPKEVILDDNVNAVIIASPTKFHKEQAELAMKGRKAVYCEKPLGLNPQESQELADKVKQLELPNQTGLVLRHSPSCNYIKQLLEDGRFGNPVLVNYRHDSCFPSGGIYRGDWKKDKEVSGGGVLKEASVHDIDLLMWLFGDFEAKKTEMRMQDGIDTAVNSELYVEGGPKIMFNSFWHDIQKRGTSRRMEIYCENGLIVADDFLFSGPIQYQLSDESMKTVTAKDLFRGYLEQNGIDKNFKRYRQWYSSLADFSFYEALKDSDKCKPDFEVAARTDKKVQEIYDNARMVK